MSKVIAKYPVTIPLVGRKVMGIIPGTEVEITKKDEKYVLIIHPIETIKKMARKVHG